MTLFANSACSQGSPVLNPYNEEASDIVVQTMSEFGIEQGPMGFIEEGMWKYESETSAVVAFETSERASARLEWGSTTDYGNSQTDGELHYIHIFLVTGLLPGTTYFYRMTAADRSGTKTAISSDYILTTKNFTGMQNFTRIPDGMPNGPPYLLNKTNNYYLVTSDITANWTAFTVASSNITLDLGGHTVIYNVIPMGLPTDSYNFQRDNSAFGIKVMAPQPKTANNTRIFNGRIVQGAGNDNSSYASIGFNPIYLTGGAGSEIAGLYIEYAGTQLSGIRYHYPGPNLSTHHNIINDLGKYVFDREQKISAVKSFTGIAYNNLIENARQCGFTTAEPRSKVRGNEIHIISYAINSFGIDLKSNSEAFGNKVFGAGDNVVGIATTGNTTNNSIYGNYIWLQAHNITEMMPYINADGFQGSDISVMSGARITWGCNGVDYYNNTFLMTAREEGMVRGSFLFSDADSKNATFRDNLVVAISEDNQTKYWGAIAGVGNRNISSVPIIFMNNVIASNFANFNLKDDYGTSMNYLFINNTFVKIGNRSDYLTIRTRSGYASYGHRFIDSKFLGGASYEKSSLYPYDSFTAEWTVTIETPVTTLVRIIDNNGTTVFNEAMQASAISIPLVEFKRTGINVANKTPHTIIASYQGQEANQTIFVDKKQSVNFFGANGTELPGDMPHAIRIKIEPQGRAGRSLGGRLIAFSLSNNTIYDINFTANSTGDYTTNLSGADEMVRLKIIVPGFLARTVNNVNVTSAPFIIFPPLLAGDINGDNLISDADFWNMNNKWYQPDSVADFNDDGLVNSLDFSLMNRNWQKTGE
jgi:hypothetical protein